MNKPVRRQASVERTRELRRASTGPERKLWQLLRGRRLGSLKFRRQAPLGPFVVDFYCAEAGLVIELDGDSHDGHDDYDFRRTAHLETMGLRVLRIANDDFLQDEEAVLRGIAQAAGIDFESPSPLRGRGPG